MSRFWTCEQITYCNCDALSYTHMHCPCVRCNGKAVSRSTEYRHWQGANAERSEAFSLNHCCNATNYLMDPCDSNQDLDIQLDGETDAELTLMDTATTTSTDVATEVIATDQVHNLDADNEKEANPLAQHNISDR